MPPTPYIVPPRKRRLEHQQRRGTLSVRAGASTTPTVVPEKDRNWRPREFHL